MPSKSKYSVIIANDLRSGRSVFFTAESGWTDSLAKADLLEADQTEVRLQVALADECTNLVIDPYLVGLSDNGLTDPASVIDIRERIRVEGPSILTQNAWPLSAALAG